MVSADSTRFLGIVRSNRTAAFIVDCLKKETNAEEIEAKMRKQFDAPQESVKRDVRMVIEKLTGIGAIEGDGSF
jgi:AAA+ ATPase superfamily predicted ATPase